MAKRDLSERFWEKINKGDPNACWEWNSAKTRAGYGYFTIDGNKQVYAHRLSYKLKNGDIPDGLFICHKCDNPPCCNPNHLYAGTRKDNARDSVERGLLADKRLDSFKSQRISQKLNEIKRVYGIDEIEADRIWEESNQGTPIKKLASQWKISDYVVTQIIRLKNGIAPRKISAY